MASIINIGTTCWDVASAEQTGLLIDGRDYYRAFYRAARAAKRYILISGWQFDSNVMLLRGEDAADGDEVCLLSFLNGLCEKNENLQIYILAWNFNAIYGIDREWFQKWYFNWTTNDRLTFCFDDCHCLAASHHQKFAVVDGTVAFLGGLDLCSSRWDDRDHCADNPQRVNADQNTYTPFHDVQSYHVGTVAKKLADLFKERWKLACCKDLDLPETTEKERIDFPGSFPILSSRVGISRTQEKTDDGRQGSHQEIRRLFASAIESAENLIYLENQYFSSKALFRALSRRMIDSGRPPLEIVMVLAKDANAFFEKISIGLMQAKLIARLKELASEMGHKVGIYYPACVDADGQEVPTYIHSKLFLVDDRFLSVGSANMNNRSMGLDTEINVAWETATEECGMTESIRRIRVDLLAEHTGARDSASVRELTATKGLVDYLERLAGSGSSRLRRHPSLDVDPAEYESLTSMLPNGFPFDMEERESENVIYETISDQSDGLFAKGIASLKNMFKTAGAD
jgi:phospholipase D1/2